MAKVYTGQRVFLSPIFAGPERFLYRVLRVNPSREQDWKAYAKSLLLFSLAGWLLLYLIVRTQNAFFVPHALNPLGFHSAPWNVTFNTVSSFVTNTNWQYYGGETTMTYLSQMAGSRSRTGCRQVSGSSSRWRSCGASSAAAARASATSGRTSCARSSTCSRRSAWWARCCSSPRARSRTSRGYLTAHTLTGLTQTIAMGPVASQEVIKELGTNGGGFFNVNSAHPFENPTAFTNLVEMLLVLIIPAALVFMYGRMTGNRRQGYAIYGVMMVMFLGAVSVAYIAEAHGSPAQHAAGLHTHVISGSTGGNMEGKEQRFGIAGSALFDVVTTVTSCGAVNSAIESYTGIGGAVPMANLSASEVIFGGVGTGLYSMLLYVLLAVFIGGLMVGRTPEWLGKKLEAREIKLAGLGILITPLAALFCTAMATATKSGTCVDIRSGGGRPAGVLGDASTPTCPRPTTTARPSPATPATSSRTLATSAPTASPSRTCWAASPCSSPASRRSCSPSPSRERSPASASHPRGLGTMRTDNATFAVLLIGVVVLVGALTFFPALLLGPIVQGLTGHLY